MVSIPAIVFILMARVITPPHLEVETVREIEKSVLLQGDTLKVQITIANRGEELAILRVTDELPRNMKLVDGSNVILVSLKKDETKIFTYSVSPSLPGRYIFSDLKVEAMDPLQIFCMRKSVEAEREEEIRAYPYVETTRNSMVMLSLRNQPGENRSRRQGEGEEFYSVRNYLPGDRLKRVNWKASARHVALYTNQYTSELAGEVMIVLDSRFGLLAAGDEEEQFRYCSSAAATLAYTSLMRRNSVGLMIMGDLLEKVPPAYGYKQLRKILAALSDFRPGRRWQVSKVSSYLRLLFPRVNDVAIITPLLDEEILRAASNLHQDSFNTIVVSPDIWSSKTGNSNYLEDRVATKLFVAKRRMMIGRVRRFAVVVDWNTSTQLSHSIRGASREVRLAVT
ncbi:MAG: DUF58 domain-containing protein [Conexivisphaerales archaeon]